MAQPTLEALAEQNRLLKAQLDAQQKQIQGLRDQIAELSGSESPLARKTVVREEPGDRRIVLSGTASAGLYAGQKAGRFPNDEFRVDDARLYFDAQVLRHAFVYGELILAQREATDETFKLGELYVEVENIFGAGLPDRAANLRVGRIWIPFGLEYQRRNAIDNPLISHSVTDFWGVDEGVEVYGEMGAFSYAAAVQNGSISRLRDGNSDKSVAARVSWTAGKIQVSASAMTTGKLDATADFLSELWIGNNVFRSIGNPATTRTFAADLSQLDMSYNWTGGRVGLAGGLGRYRDDDTSADNDRDFSFFQVEASQNLWEGLYVATRYSGLTFDRGYPLSGLGNFADYFLSNELTKRIHRLGFGLGYSFSENLRVKTEYTIENAREASGEKRKNENQFAAEVAVKF